MGRKCKRWTIQCSQWTRSLGRRDGTRWWLLSGRLYVMAVVATLTSHQLLGFDNAHTWTELSRPTKRPRRNWESAAMTAVRLECPSHRHVSYCSVLLQVTFSSLHVSLSTMYNSQRDFNQHGRWLVSTSLLWFVLWAPWQLSVPATTLRHYNTMSLSLTRKLFSLKS